MLHLVPGNTIAGTLAAAGIHPVLALGDPLSVGPLSARCEDLQRLREIFWADVAKPLGSGLANLPTECRDEYTKVLQHLASVSADEQLIVWVGPRLDDQLFVLWISAMQRDWCPDVNLQYVLADSEPLTGKPISNLVHLNGTSLQKLLDSRYPATKEDVRALSELWIDLASSDPNRINRALNELNHGAVLAFGKALPLYKRRFPILGIGVPGYFCDLLAVVKQRGPKASSIVANFMSRTADDLDRLSDLVVRSLLDAGSHDEVAEPVFSIEGSVANLGTCRVSLTSFGENLLQRYTDHGDVLPGRCEPAVKTVLPSQFPNWWYNPNDDQLVFSGTVQQGTDRD